MPLFLIVAGLAALGVGVGIVLHANRGTMSTPPIPPIGGDKNSLSPVPLVPGQTPAGATVADVKSDGTAERGAVEPADRFYPSAPSVAGIRLVVEDPFTDDQEYDPTLKPFDIEPSIPSPVLWTIDDSVTPSDLAKAPDEIQSDKQERLG